MRKLSVLTLALLYVLTLAAVSAFGANAARFGGDNQPHMVSIDTRQQPASETGPEPANVGKESSSYSSALGFYMSPGLLVETTDYDLFSNSRQQRYIAVGSDGRVHIDWTWKAVAAPLTTRACHYTSWTSGGGFTPIVSVSDDDAKTPGRFVALDVFGVKAVPIWHYTKNPTITMTTSAIDAGSGAGAFAALNPPSDVINCQNIVCRNVAPAVWPGYIWPVVAVGKDVPGPGGNCVVHIVAMEGNTSAGWSAIAYFRGQGNATGFVMTPLTQMYGTCGMYVDSTSATAYDVAADPNGPGVVIAYPKSRQGNRVNNDLAYRLSSNYGLPGSWGGVVNVTNYATGAMERAAEDCSVLFDGHHCFHILWIGSPYDSVKNDVSDQEAKLYHWSSCTPTCQSLVLDANNHDNNVSMKAFQQNICKINLTLCARPGGTNDTLLYAVYSRYTGTTAAPDRSAKNYPNGEVYISASSTWGETWGAPVNVTNTPTPGCTAGNCADDIYTSSVRYATDNLYIGYMEDLDAGSFISNESSTADLLNPVRLLSHSCFDMTPYQVLTCTPSRIKYPFHAVRNSSAQQPLVLTNGGNQSVIYSSSITYTNGSNWITPLGGGTVTAGCTNSAGLTLTATSGNTEGLFKATVKFTYNGGAAFTEVPVDFYVFDSWFLPQNIDIRTSTNRMNVNQVGQIADNTDKMSFSYFADLTKNFITDGSLVLGTSAANLSWKIFSNGQGDPTAGNNFGLLYALGNTTYDSAGVSGPTSWPGNGYRKAYGKGTNRDSTLGFDVTYFAPKHVDSAGFYIAHFDLHKGVNNPAGTVTGLTVAFATDWDLPDDSNGTDNTAGSDASRQAIWLRGSYTPTLEKGYGALAAWRDDAVPITGGFTWTNQTHVYPLKGYQVDSLWNWLSTTNTYRPLPVDSNTDQSVVLIIGKNLTIGPATHFRFSVIIAGERGQDNAAGQAGLEATLDGGKAFNANYLVCTTCGDANGDAAIDISDAVFLIQYIFAGGPAPGDCVNPQGLGDANGDAAVDISDAVYLIQYIFAGGPTPHCP